METSKENESRGNANEFGQSSGGSEQSKSTVNARTEIEGSPRSEDNGSEELVNKYNVNDQAHSDSSLNDFVNTTSNFHHEDEYPENQTPD
ncbi:MAG: hypothetical protein EOO48_01005 [Flavobacterium sp.]|nr:MAG: hypothetical protein EOO48_01005 [Flavobacterium sp.]